MIHALSGRLGATAGGRSEASPNRRLRTADVVAAVALLLIGALYFWHLDGWLINDDEGSYLYAAWRISLGELPYRDFLTPQLPAFLLPGGLLMRLTGPAALPARSLAVLLALGAGVATWATARRLFGPLVALVAGAALLLHPAVFQACRTYRPEPFMLFFATVAVALFARGAFPRVGALDPPSRPWLAAAGAAFGLATLSKLFGPFVMAGCVAWLLADAVRRRRSASAVIGDLLAVAVAWGLVVAVGLGAFMLADRGVYDAVLGHHLRQGSGEPLLKVMGQGVRFYTEVLRQAGNGLLVFVSIAVGWLTWREARRRPGPFAWQLPTLLIFLFMSRQLFPRHIVYLVPAMATLFSLAIAWLATGGTGLTPPGAASASSPSAARGNGSLTPERGRWLAAAVAAGLLVPWLISDWHWAWEWESGTQRLADFVSLMTAPDDIVLSDYSELDFYADRPTTRSAASLSAGAARSGQIGWSRPESPNRLIDELGGVLPPLVIVDTSEDYGHLRFLRDGGAFEEWLAANYGEPVGQIQRHHQLYDVYAPGGELPATAAVFEAGPTLLAAASAPPTAAPGDDVEVITAWQSTGPTSAPLGATVRLVDSSGREWAQGDVLLHASGANSLRVRTTDEWRAGELTSDRLPLEIPVGTPPGEFELTLGLYDSESLAGLNAFDGVGSPIGREVSVGKLTVVPSGLGAANVPPDALDATAEPASPPSELKLLGRGPLPRDRLQAGDMIEIELWWQGPRTDEDRLVHVTLGDPKVGSVAADWSEPLGAPGTGSSAWPDRPTLVRQLVRVPLLAHAAEGDYRLTVSLVDESGAPVGPGATWDLGRVGVMARDPSSITTEPPQVDRPLDARFGSVAELYGVTAPTAVEPGTELAVDLVWRAITTPAVAYKVSVQLLDEAGAVIAQHDSEPAEWSRPTTGWLPGEYIVDRHSMEVPPDAAPGEHSLVAAMYDPRTSARLPVAGADAGGEGSGDSAVPDHASLGIVQLR